MKPINNFSISGAQIAQHAVLILKVEGYFRASTTISWLQVHDNNATPATGAVPLKEWPVYATTEFYKEFKHGDLTCNLGCYAGLSTTEGTYTASTDTMDVSVELSSPELPAHVSYAGDLTTAVTGLQVWAEAAGAAARQSLVALEVDGTNLTGGPQFIMLFATDTVNVGDSPVNGAIFPIASGQVRTSENKLTFGEFGRQIFSIDGEPNDQGTGGGAVPGAKRLGCTVKISSTPLTYAPGNGTAAIKAEYRQEP